MLTIDFSWLRSKLTSACEFRDTRTSTASKRAVTKLLSVEGKASHRLSRFRPKGDAVLSNMRNRGDSFVLESDEGNTPRALRRLDGIIRRDLKCIYST